MTKRILFCDMDGTVVNSMPFLSRLGALLTQKAMPDLSLDACVAAYIRNVGRPFVQQLRLAARNDTEAQAADAWAALYADIHMEAAPLFPLTPLGLQLVAMTTHELNWLFVLVSSTSEDIINGMPQITRIQWDLVMGYRQPNYTKTDQVREALMRYGVDGGNCHYIGDSPSDIFVAEEFGMAYWRETTPLSKILTSRL